MLLFNRSEVPAAGIYPMLLPISSFRRVIHVTGTGRPGSRPVSLPRPGRLFPAPSAI